MNHGSVIVNSENSCYQWRFLDEAQNFPGPISREITDTREIACFGLHVSQCTKLIKLPKIQTRKVPE